MAGEAERVGIKSEQDVVEIVKEVREQMWREENANNAGH